MNNFSRKGTKAQRKTQRGLLKYSAPNFAPLRLCAKYLLLIFLLLASFTAAPSQDRSGSHTTRVRSSMSPEARALLDEAIGVVCTQAKLDPKSSVAIDDMQARPSLPLQSPEARAGAERA